VFTSDGDRVYEIGLWSEEPGLDARGTEFLGKLRFRAPKQDVHSLGLTKHTEAVYTAPPPDIAEELALAAQRRGMMARVAADQDPAFKHATQNEMLDPPVPEGTSAANGCGFTAPADLYWQLQWDDTNTFYSGTYYNLRNRSGWSAMSGNYGSWWGTNYHVGLCYTGYSNQYYANDWPAQHWANAYAAFSGYVEWAGWGTDGFKTLGRYVVVRSGNYRSTTAHLTAIRKGVTWGAWIDGYWDTIGWAGDTGGPWDPHLHARVTWGESLTWNGQPYGGQSVKPNRLRCFDCTDYDLEAAGAGGFYTSFWHGRWMRY
jgi:murein DD-endopeptidase MepM/ murein hydrolase activator NlpD